LLREKKKLSELSKSIKSRLPMIIIESQGINQGMKKKNKHKHKVIHKLLNLRM